MTRLAGRETVAGVALVPICKGRNRDECWKGYSPCFELSTGEHRQVPHPRRWANARFQRRPLTRARRNHGSPAAPADRPAGKRSDRA